MPCRHATFLFSFHKGISPAPDEKRQIAEPTKPKHASAGNGRKNVPPAIGTIPFPKKTLSRSPLPRISPAACRNSVFLLFGPTRLSHAAEFSRAFPEKTRPAARLLPSQEKRLTFPANLSRFPKTVRSAVLGFRENGNAPSPVGSPAGMHLCGPTMPGKVSRLRHIVFYPRIAYVLPQCMRGSPCLNIAASSAA